MTKFKFTRIKSKKKKKKGGLINIRWFFFLSFNLKLANRNNDAAVQPSYAEISSKLILFQVP